MPEERNDARQLSPVLENYLEIIFHQEIREGAARASSIGGRVPLHRHQHAEGAEKHGLCGL